ncbi:IolE Sugar phosphate isomerases/epimerases [Candidatus Pelagibacterales bacterium]
MKLGIMQGRLVPSEKKNSIQYFPEKQWKKEINLMIKNDIKILEWTINIENIRKNHLFNEKLNKELIQFVCNKNIQIPSVTCDFFMQKPFFKEKKFRKTLEDLKKVIKLSQNIGVKFIILPLVDFSSIENSYQEEILIVEMKKISKHLKPKQKILFEIDYPPNKVLKFLKKLDHKFGINYDTGNSASLGYDFEEEKKYFKYVRNIHLKDRLFRGSTVRLGNGDYEFKKFFTFLKKIKYKNNLILQTARGLNDLSEIKVNKNFVENYL